MSDLAPEKKAQIRNSAQRIIGGLDDMWFHLVRVHGDALILDYSNDKGTSHERASVKLLKQMVDESGELQRQIAQRKP